MIIKACFLCDFFLLGHLKSKVYISQPSDLETADTPKKKLIREES